MKDQKLFENISKTDNVKKLEQTCMMSLLGISFSDEKDFHRKVFQTAQDRLKVLCLIKGIECPMCDIDISDETKLRRVVGTSLICSLIEKGIINVDDTDEIELEIGNLKVKKEGSFVDDLINNIPLN